MMKRFFCAVSFCLIALCVSIFTLGVGFYVGFDTKLIQCLTRTTSSFFFPSLTYDSIQWKFPLEITLNKVCWKQHFDLFAERVNLNCKIGSSLSCCCLLSLTLEKPKWIFSNLKTIENPSQKKVRNIRTSFPIPIGKIYLNEGSIHIQQGKENLHLLSFEKIKGEIDLSFPYPVLNIQTKCVFSHSSLPGSVQAQFNCASSPSDDLFCSYFGKIDKIQLDNLNAQEIPSIEWSYQVQKKKNPTHFFQFNLSEKELATCSWTHSQNAKGMHIVPINFFLKEADLRLNGIFHIQDEQWGQDSFLTIAIGENSPFYNLIGEDGGKIFFSGNLLSPQIVFSDKKVEKEPINKSFSFPKLNKGHWSYVHRFSSERIPHDLETAIDYIFHNENNSYTITLCLSGEIPVPGDKHLFFWIDSQTNLSGCFRDAIDWREIRSLTKLEPNLPVLPRIEFSFIGEKNLQKDVKEREYFSFDSILSGKDLIAEHHSIKNFTLALSNRTGQDLAHFFSSGRVNHLPFSLEGTCQFSFFNRDSLKGMFSDLQGKIDDMTLQLDHPFKFSLSSEQVQVEEASFWINEGQILFELQQDVNAFATRFTLKNFPGQLLKSFIYVSRDGFLDGKGSLLINQSQQELHLHLREKKYFSSNSQTKSHETDITVSLLGNQIDSIIILNEKRHQPFFIKGNLPLRMQPIYPYFFLEKASPFSFKTSLYLPLSLMQSLLLKNLPWRAQGDCSLLCEVHGPINDIQIIGKIELVNGKFLYPEKGLYLTNLSGALHGEGKQISWNLLEGSSFPTGKIFSKGVLSWAQEELYLKSKIDLKNAYFFETDLLKVQGTGSLVLSLSQNEKKLTGDIEIDQAVFKIRENSQGLTTLIYPKENKTSPSIFCPDIDLNVALKTNGNLLVEGDGIFSAWNGTLQAIGSLQSPQLQGNCQSIYGTIRVGEHYFNLKQGHLIFKGSLDSTYIRLLAESPIQRHVIIATYQGNFLDPHLILSSKPAGLSTRKIVTLILLGKTDTGSIDLIETFRQTRKPNDLGNQWIRQIKNSLQIDHIGITTNPNERESHYSLQLGKHFSKNMLFILQKKLNSSEANAGIYTQISPNFSIQAEAGIPLKACLHFFWRYNY